MEEKDYEQIAARVEEWVKEHREEYIEDLIEFVNIRSVQEPAEGIYPFGKGVGRAIDKALEFGRKYGFETENDDYYNVSFLTRGKKEEELAILGHLDVVPEGTGWHYEPYQAVYKDGYVIGRGSQDNKGPALVALYTLRAMRDLGIQTEHTLRVMWGGNEETGMEDIPHFLENHRPPRETLVCDCVFPLCYGEKGNLTADLAAEISDERLVAFEGGVAANVIPDKAYVLIKENLSTVKDRLSGQDVEISEAENGLVRVEAAGVAGHSSSPETGRSAIQKLAGVLANAGLFTGTTQNLLVFLEKAFEDYEGKGLGIDFVDELNTNTTHIGGMIHMDGRRLVQNINVRYAILYDQDRLRNRLETTAKKNGFVLENYKNMAPRYDSLDDPVVQLLVDNVRTIGNENAKPFTMGGGTHARKMPHALPYGPGSMENYLAKSPFGSPHGADEALKVDSILKAIRVYAVALLKLDRYFAD